MKFRLFPPLSVFLILSFSHAAAAQNYDGAPNIIKMVQDGQYDLARKSLLSVSRNVFDIILLDVEIARAQGRTQDAIELLDEVLIQFPNFTIGRAKLAQILVEDKQFERAQYQYELLRDRSEHDKERTFFNEQIQEISSIQPYSFSVQASIVPSNNINNGHKNKDFCQSLPGGLLVCGEYPEELMAQFGWSTQIILSGDYTWSLADQHSLELGFDSVINHYSVDTLENQSVGVSLNYIYQNAINRIYFGPFFKRYWGDGKSYSHNLSTGEADMDYENENYRAKGFAFTSRHTIDKNSVIRFLAKHQRSVYDENEIWGNYRNSYEVLYGYFLDARRSWNVILGTAVFKQEVAGDWVGSANYRSMNFGIEYDHLFENNWFLGTGLSFEVENHSDFRYPGYVDTYRKDKIYGLSFDVRNQDWKVGKSVPSLSCNYHNTISNIESRSYSAFSCGVYFTNKY